MYIILCYRSDLSVCPPRGLDRGPGIVVVVVAVVAEVVVVVVVVVAAAAAAVEVVVVVAYFYLEGCPPGGPHRHKHQGHFSLGQITTLRYISYLRSP